MIDMPSNFPSFKKKETCLCDQELNMKHLYMCEFWCTDENKNKSPFENIFKDNNIRTD